MLAKSLFVLAASAALAAAAGVNEQPEARLFGSPKPTTTVAPPAGYGLVPGCVCFDSFDCMLGTQGKPCKCKSFKCFTSTTAGPTSTRKSTTTKKPTGTPLPSGVPADYALVDGCVCFDNFDCLFGTQGRPCKCKSFKCYAKPA